MKKLLLFFTVYFSAVFFIQAQFVVESLEGPVTQNEIEAFKTWAKKINLPSNWAPSSNQISYGTDGRKIEALGLMYELTKERDILNALIRYADAVLKYRNDPNTGTLDWTGERELIWLPHEPRSHAEQGLIEGKIAYAAQLILQSPSLWSETVPDGNPNGYGLTYYDRALKYVEEMELTESTYMFKWFVRPADKFYIFPNDPRYDGGTPGGQPPFNQQWMIAFGKMRMAKCYELLGNTEMAQKYKQVVQAGLSLYASQMHPANYSGHDAYVWYYPVNNTKYTEDIGHAQHGIIGMMYLDLHGGYTNFPDQLKMANAIRYAVYKPETNQWNHNVAGTNPTNYGTIQPGFLFLAKYLPGLYYTIGKDLIKDNKVTGNADVAAYLLWAKNARHAGAWPQGQDDPEPEPEPVPDNPFDITNNGGITTAQYANTSKPSESIPSLTDNSILTKYFISNKTALWIQYKSKVSAIVVRYTVISANDVPTRDPKNWTLQGSNNGSSWATLDTRTNEIFSSRRQTRTFTFENTIPYVYYRLNITANSGAPGTQLAEWELYQRKTQTILFPEIPEKTYGDDPFELITSASSGLDVTLEVVSGPATLDGDFLIISGAGTVTIRATQAGDVNYFLTVVERTFTVNKASQTIVFDPIETKTYGDEPFDLNATASTGLPILFEVLSGPATAEGSTLAITGAGDVTVRAIQTGNENYLSAIADQTFTINRAEQTITFEAIAPRHDQDVLELSAVASSGLPVLFDIISGPGVLNGNSLSFSGDGIVVIEASQPGNENYLAASTVEQSVLVYADDSKKDGIRLIVHPNPTKGKLKVKLDNKKDKQYSFAVYDEHGNIVTTTVIPKSHKMFEVDFDLSESANGMYYLWVSDGTEVTVRRIIKE